MRLTLKRIVSKKPVSELIDQLASAIGAPVAIEDADGDVIRSVGATRDLLRHPVSINGETVGWVVGGRSASAIAAVLAHTGTLEFEKKTLAQETLEKYKELALLYDMADKLTTCLNVGEVARLAIQEARRMISSTDAAVLLMDDHSGNLEAVGSYGETIRGNLCVKPGEGIAGNVFLSGQAEIVNDVRSDPRYIVGETGLRSMICAPLRTNDRTIGVITIGSNEAATYGSEELKLFTALALQSGSAIENAVFYENRFRQERLRSNLERYIAPQIVDAIVNEKGDIPLVPSRRNIAILFSDIRNFSTKCEQMRPEKMVGYLNRYFTHMVDIIFEHGGTLNKFVGDMIIALFGAPTMYPDNENRTIQSAIEMQKCMRSIPDRWIRDNFNTGIGINSGEVVVGNVGSPKHMDYTAIGDEVNVAERLQSIAAGGQIFVSRKVYENTKSSFSFREHGAVIVKGRKEAVEVYEVKY